MDPFVTKLVDHWPAAGDRQHQVLVALSGGADSVALLHAVASLLGPTDSLFAIHVNHRLRGPASDDDEQFCEHLCRQLDVPLTIRRLEAGEIDQATPGRGMEAVARDKRYECLIQSACHRGARYLLTAHTYDDQAETILHHVLRGTGLAGLAGMSACRPVHEAVTLVRPLLQHTRQDVLNYLERLEQSYRVDSHNLDPTYTRSRIRTQLLPHLRERYNSEIDHALCRLGRIAADAQAALTFWAQQQREKYTVPEENGVAIAVEAFVEVPRHVCREIFVCIWQRQQWPLQSMSFQHWDRLAHLACEGGPPNRLQFPDHVNVVHVGDCIRLYRDSSK